MSQMTKGDLPRMGKEKRERGESEREKRRNREKRRQRRKGGMCVGGLLV